MIPALLAAAALLPLGYILALLHVDTCRSYDERTLGFWAPPLALPAPPRLAIEAAPVPGGVQGVRIGSAVAGAPDTHRPCAGV